MFCCLSVKSLLRMLSLLPRGYSNNCMVGGPYESSLRLRGGVRTNKRNGMNQQQARKEFSG